ncbi:hypothetical protein SAMN05444349_12576 [Bacteroides faecichinchillae]|uniref:DUF3221 domain-containing protein n=2 Tax=Bacteroides TaxID=816 RepID=A0A1M5CTA3_9BACE|nr:hypothetical protein [Bacteroides faecichinchillae]THG65771.1 hypothetical protein E5981_11520 [Bacteroides faecichinchillae]SHF57877.1 hypothetical protein SAMN05444349_12576 [Bacteroides faecichinchillae]
MNKSIVSLAVLAIVYFSSCQPKSGQTSNNEDQVIDSITAHIEDEKVITGVVKDVSMNNFMLITEKEDTIFISTMDQEPNEVSGFELGDTVKVNFIEEEEEPGLNTIITAKKVVIVGKENKTGN